MNPADQTAGDRHIIIIAGEESGDQLAASLMRDLKVRDPRLRFSGVGGERMAREGLETYFPMAEISLNGLGAILRRLPRLLRLIRETSERIIERKPDALIIVDAPEFTHRVAKRVRRALPDLPIINYVPPTVWAVRPWRAKAMREYVDLALAILPFEPEAHDRLGGPPCHYVGHPVARILGERQKAPEAVVKPVTLIVLPGSRYTEVSRHMGPFGETVARLEPLPDRIIIPAVTHLADVIREQADHWPVRAEIVTGEEAKWEAFSSASAALAASGTVTLELGLMRVPHVIGYRIEFIISLFLPLLKIHSVGMSNLVIGRQAMPEFLHKACTPENLSRALQPLLENSDARREQVDALRSLGDKIDGDGDRSLDAAKAVLDLIDGAPKKGGK